MPGRGQTAGRRAGSFDAFDVAHRRASFTGVFDAAASSRAAELLAPEGGIAEVRWRVEGTADPMDRPALEISLDGAVPLVCQRCLKPFAWPVRQRTLLLLARDASSLAELDAEDEHEVILAAAATDTATLVEDELLLTLPFAPRCERAECVQSGLAGASDAIARAPAPAFAALAAIKSGRAKKGKN